MGSFALSSLLVVKYLTCIDVLQQRVAVASAHTHASTIEDALNGTQVKCLSHLFPQLPRPVCDRSAATFVVFRCGAFAIDIGAKK